MTEDDELVGGVVYEVDHQLQAKARALFKAAQASHDAEPDIASEAEFAECVLNADAKH